jgi:hypothetical protein
MAFPGYTQSMSSAGTIFGWAFGDIPRADEPGYMERLQEQALENARKDAAAKGVEVEPGSEVFTVVRRGHSLIDADMAVGGLIVRCMVHVQGAKAWKLHAEGPMNG